MAIPRHAESETAISALSIPAQLRKAFMQVIRSPADAANIADPAIRQMILQRIVAIASDEPYDSDLHGYFLALVEGDTEGDTLAAITFSMKQLFYTNMCVFHFFRRTSICY